MQYIIISYLRTYTLFMNTVSHPHYQNTTTTTTTTDTTVTTIRDVTMVFFLSRHTRTKRTDDIKSIANTWAINERKKKRNKTINLRYAYSPPNVRIIIFTRNSWWRKTNCRSYRYIFCAKPTKSIHAHQHTPLTACSSGSWNQRPACDAVVKRWIIAIGTPYTSSR